MHAQVVVLLDGKAVTGFSFEDSVFKTTCAFKPDSVLGVSAFGKHPDCALYHVPIIIHVCPPGSQAAAQGMRLLVLSIGDSKFTPNKLACACQAGKYKR